MSQWNNSYAYNNQYQGANTWNSEMNGQYGNQGFYPNPNNQYVSFTEFLSQMQGNNEAASNNTNYNNMQYQNYPHNQQYNYQEVPSSSQNAQMQSYAYNSNPNNTNTEDSTAPVNPIPKKDITSDIVINSNLTPTAIEFVPKSSNIVMSSNIDAQPESSTSYKPTKESRSVHGSSSDKNWRERPQSSHDSSRPSDSFKQNESNTNDSSTYKNYDSNSYNRESNNKNRNRDRKNDSRNYSTENSGHSNGSQSNYDSSNRQTDNGRNYGSSRRNYDSNHDDSNGQYESSNYDSNGRNYESSSRYNENRGLFKGKGKKDSDRTFYNSAINKNQDVRNGRGEGPNKKNWIGSQRLRAGDRNSVEDEQYASSYLQSREDREKSVKPENLPSPRRNKSAGDQKGTVNKEMTQRERLTEQLNKGTLECLVCCERVKQTDSVWSCANCYHVLHLRCIKKWATSSVVEGKWRCPACQNTSEQIPSEYWCLCGAVRSPEWARGAAGAHSCGRGCRRARTCTHACPLPCHPGPCPPCQAMVTKECGCGVEKRQMMCSNKQPLECGRSCGRDLLCGRHHCEQPCHPPPCEPCTHTVMQECACKTPQSRTVPCTAESSGTGWFACGGPCARVLSCGVHACSRMCHSGDCEPCKLMPEYVTTCPCGKNRLEKDKRKACTDPIPVCGNICAKPLSCGPAGDKHFCKIDCHEGACPVCPDSTLMQCRCGHSSREVPCAELPDVGAYVLCQKKCNKKLSCGRHRCRAVCCAAERSGQHRCGVVCGRALSCQLHRCEEFCHTGHCAPCPRLSFEELRCSCGAEVVYPPVRCGARPPACSAECTRARPCGHAAHHACHAGDCPPCVVLTTKMCHGRHEERKTIPCSQDEFSCGLPCGKPLSCGKHTCIKTCHKGPCDSTKCAQPCTAPRTVCGHWCAAACHAGAGAGTPCPASAPCRRAVTASCQCGRRKLERSCADNAKDLAKMMAALTASRVQEGGAVDLSDVQRPSAMLKTLECDDTCRAEARSRQLALALQIRNPDVQAKLAPRYGESLRALAAREPSFAHNAHEKLTELVQRAKKSKQKTRSYSFPSMNWQKRQFIHELCEHFGCESVAYDAEPNRNVVATADREKSWLPAMSVLEVVSREAGKRRVPGPVLRAPPTAQPSASTAGAAKPSSGWATLTSTNAWAARSQARAAAPAAPSAPITATLAPATPTPADPPKIDYFDNPPE